MPIPIEHLSPDFCNKRWAPASAQPTCSFLQTAYSPTWLTVDSVNPVEMVSLSLSLPGVLAVV